MKKNDFLAWVTVILGSLLCGTIPFFFYHVATGSFLPHMIPQLEEDTLYYLTQVKVIMSGHIGVGNPYIRDYADAVFPGLLLPLWIAALPGLLGIGINAVYAVDLLFYSLLTGILLFLLCKKINRSAPFTVALLSVLGVGSMHNNLLRPGIMQVIYPAFILFMMSLLWVLRSPHARKGYVALGITTTLAFYLYPFLWMTAFTAVSLTVLLLLIRKDTKALTMSLIMIGCVIIACIPQILTVVSLFRDTLAHELNVRVGLTETYTVLLLTFWNMKYAIVVAATLLLLAMKRKLTTEETLVMFIGLALFIGSVSNVVTGKLMDFETHFWRLSLPWQIVAVVVLLKSSLEARKMPEKLLTGICCTLVFLTAGSRVFIRMNAFGYLRRTEAIAALHKDLESYEPLFTFIREKVPEHSVLLSPLEVGGLLPLYSKSYPMYHFKAMYNTIPNSELQMRFLTAYVDHIDEAFLKHYLVYIVGIGPQQQARYANGDSWTYLDFVENGDTLILKLLKERNDISTRYAEYLKKFQAEYVITDTKDAFNPRVPAKAKKIYSDARFTLYEI